MIGWNRIKKKKIKNKNRVLDFKAGGVEFQITSSLHILSY